MQVAPIQETDKIDILKKMAGGKDPVDSAESLRLLVRKIDQTPIRKTAGGYFLPVHAGHRETDTETMSYTYGHRQYGITDELFGKWHPFLLGGMCTADTVPPVSVYVH